MTRSSSRWRDQPASSPAQTPSSLQDSRRPRSPRLPTQGTQEVFDTIVKGRKSWKTLRGGEVVWPPELEAALLEGLESYQPDDSRETRLLGRFPLRNRFISDYILQKTGKHRTPKQVGSRLQQLRDTCGGKELLSLLSPCRIPGRTPSNHLYHRSSSIPSDSSDGSSSGPSSPTERDPHGSAMSPWNSSAGISTSVICIDILPDNPSYSSSPVSPSFPVGYSSHHSADNGSDEVKLAQQPRPLRFVDPTLTFLSHSAISATALFTVTLNGQNIHTDLVPLTLRGPSQPFPSVDIDGAFVYSTTLVPDFWQTIVESDDPTKYTIQTEVYKESSAGTSIMYSAIFKFKFAYPAGSSNGRHQPYTPPACGPASGLGVVPEHVFLDGVGVDALTVSDCHKPYPFNGYEHSWDVPQLSPGSESGSSGYRSQSSQGYSSRGNSASPTVAHFPTNMYHYQS